MYGSKYPCIPNQRQWFCILLDLSWDNTRRELEYQRYFELIGAEWRIYASVKWNSYIFIQEQCIWKCRLENGVYFVWPQCVFRTSTNWQYVTTKNNTRASYERHGFSNHPWWRHQMETFSALLVRCAGNSPVPGDFPAQRPVTRSFDVSLICAWINGWVNKRVAGDLRCHRGHYDVTVMFISIV